MDLTILITASINPTHPNIDLIKNVIESLEYEKSIKDKINVLLCHDAINLETHFKNKLEYEKSCEIYKKYFTNLEKYICKYNKDSSRFNLLIIKNKEWGHLTGNLKNALNFVKTKYILVLQHDLSFCKNFHLESIINDMKNNSKLKHIQFNRTKNIPINWFKDKYNFFGTHNIKTEKNNYVSTLSWADQNHLTTKKYYTDIVFQISKNGSFMEKHLHQKNNSPETHKRFGTYFFGQNNESNYINHINISTFWKNKYK